MTTASDTRVLVGLDPSGAARRLRLTGRANRFIGILRDFGHLSEDQIDALLAGLLHAHGGVPETVADLPVVRIAAAAMIFRNDPAGEDGESLLAEDWPFLFF